MPSLCISDSMTLAIGVPSSAFMWTPPFSAPLAWPNSASGQRRWLWMLGSAIGEPQITIDLSSRLASPSIVVFSFSSRCAIWPTRYLQILLNSMIRSSRLPWCEAGWNGWFDPLSGKTRFCASRPILNEMTRVMSVCSASTCRSNSSRMCSENESGTPAGASGSARASPLRLCASTAWMRRSISRTLSM